MKTNKLLFTILVLVIIVSSKTTAKADVYNINIFNNYYINQTNLNSILSPSNDNYTEFCMTHGVAGITALLTMKDMIQKEQQKIEEATHTLHIKYEEYPGYFDKYRDLYNRMDITENDINLIIEKYTVHRENSVFENNGLAFIKASNYTGLDPVFLVALAGYESGWGTSEKHISKNNYYSINMTDENPHNGFDLGDTFEEGIINGAIWIKENYYDEGKTTLDTMNKSYCSSALWKRDIRIIMTNSFRYIIKSHKEVD